jgi:hypothetical protein
MDHGHWGQGQWRINRVNLLVPVPWTPPKAIQSLLKQPIFILCSVWVTRRWTNNRGFIRRKNVLTAFVFAIPLLKSPMVLYGKADQKTETVKVQNRSKPVALGPITGLTITQNHDPGLSAKWQELLVFLDGQDAPRQNSLGGAFLPKGTIFTQGKSLEGTQAFGATFFLIVALEPNLTIGMGCC